jgi:hypothetical protein
MEKDEKTTPISHETMMAFVSLHIVASISSTGGNSGGEASALLQKPSELLGGGGLFEAGVEA